MVEGKLTFFLPGAGLVLVKAKFIINRSSSIFECRIDRGRSPETLITSLCVEGQSTRRASYLSSLLERELARNDE